MTNVKQILTKLSVVLSSTIVLLGTAPCAFAQEHIFSKVGCAVFLFDFSGSELPSECQESETDDAAAIALALVGGGALVYFVARDKSEEERLLMYRNYLQGKGIRVTGDHSKFSVDLMLLRRPGPEYSGPIGNNFDNHSGQASSAIDLVKVRF